MWELCLQYSVNTNPNIMKPVNENIKRVAYLGNINVDIFSWYAYKKIWSDKANYYAW